MAPTTSDEEKMSQKDSKASTKTESGSYVGEKRKDSDDHVVNIQLDIGDGQVRVRTHWWKFW